jgi:HK97 family phage major capsid protein
MSIQALREQRAAKAKSLNELVTKTDWNAEKDQPVYDAGMKELDALDTQIANINAVNAKLAEEALTENVAIVAERGAHDNKSKPLEIFAKWVRNGDEALTREDWAIVRNTMSTSTNSEGGYTVATEVASKVLDALKAGPGAMRKVSTVIQASGIGDINIPTSDGTSEVGEIIAQNTTATAADPTFSVKTLTAYKYSSKIVAVPFELLQDSNVDVEAFVINRLATRLGRITNQHFTTGTGSSQPTGVVTGASSGVAAATGNSTSITYDNLVAMQHSIDPAYRELGNCRWMFNDTTLKLIRQLKDSQNRPLFVPGYEVGVPGGMPDTLLGNPISINQDVANMAASAKSLLFGDFSFYNILDKMDVQMFRFTDSAYTKLGQVGFLAWMRTGGNLIDVGGAVKYYQNSAT